MYRPLIRRTTNAASTSALDSFYFRLFRLRLLSSVVVLPVAVEEDESRPMRREIEPSCALAGRAQVAPLGGYRIMQQMERIKP